MTTAVATAITITACVCSVIITGLLMLGTGLGGKLKEKVYRWFFIMLFINTMGTCCEGVAVMLIGLPGENIMIIFQLLDFLSYACGSLVGIALSLYVYEYLSFKKDVRKAPFVFMVACLSVNIVLHAIEHITARFALLDANNNYDPQNLTMMAQVLPTLMMLTLIAVVLHNIKLLAPREWMSLLAYVAIPLICYGIENYFIDYPVWITYFGVAVLLLLLYVNIQVELNFMLIKKESELTESRTAIMLSQIQPHFLYNSLTAIGKLCDLDPGKAKAAVTDFADYLRGNLDSVRERKLTGFSNELEHIEAYLALEQLRYKERLRVIYEITVEDFVLPPLTIQPIVENAVQHGLMEKKEGGTVCIRTEAEKDIVRVIVSDDGMGFDPAEQKDDGRTHIGIENVRGRLAALCHGSLEIQSVPGTGTTAVITVPYHSDKEDRYEYNRD